MIRRIFGPKADPDRLTEELHIEEGNPLLASYGRVGRDFQQVLEECADYAEPGFDLYEDPGAGAAGTALATLQSDILNLRTRAKAMPDEPCRIAADDTSISIHSCHGPMREVEVLHDQLLAMFDSDPSLEPEDVCVMAPDLNKYAPYIQAVFLDGHGRKPLIPFCMSENVARFDSQVADALFALLDMVCGRFKLHEVFDFISMEVVHTKFGLDSKDVETLFKWAFESQVRWGIDSDHRALFGQPDFNENTWRFGLDRLLLGYAMPGGDEVLFCGALPYDEIEGQEASRLGRFVELCETLFPKAFALKEPRNMATWSRDLKELLDRFILRDHRNEHQHRLVREALADLQAQAELAAFGDPIGLDVVGRALKSRLDESRLPGGFLSKGVTFSSIAPARSIPFRAICLMGVNDGDFPRPNRALGFDLMAQKPLVGDRSGRRDDNYLFLEALLAARERLLITYEGQSIRDNSAKPPSAVVSDLLDAIGQSFCFDQPSNSDSSGKVLDVRERLVVRHPLAPFSPRYFGAGGDSRLFTYSADYLKGARAISSPRKDAPVFLSGPLPGLAGESPVVRLEDLVSFFRSPCRYLLQKRLGIYLEDEAGEADDREPVEYAALDEYAIGSLLLDWMLDGRACDNLYPILRAKGVLPLGTLGRQRFFELISKVEPVALAVKAETFGPALEPLTVDLTFAKSRLIGRLGNIWPDARVQYRFANLRAKHTIELWIGHLAQSCMAKDRYPLKSVWIGRAKNNSSDRIALKKLKGDPAALLADLVDLYLLGQTQPLRFFPQTSADHAAARLEARSDGGRATRDAEVAPIGRWGDTFEQEDLATRRFFSNEDPLTGRGPSLQNDFAELAVRVFDPLLGCIE